MAADPSAPRKEPETQASEEAINTHCVLCAEPLGVNPSIASVHKACAFSMEVGRVVGSDHAEIAREICPRARQSDHLSCRTCVRIIEALDRISGQALERAAEVAERVPMDRPTARAVVAAILGVARGE